MSRASIGFQFSSRAEPRETFAYYVGPRSTDYGVTQPAYIALHLGGHDGVRVSISAEHAREVAALLLRMVDEGEPPIDTSGPSRYANGPELVSS